MPRLPRFPACAFAAALIAAAQFPPGYVDPAPVLDAATRAIAADRIRCLSVAGTAYAGMVGQQRESAWNIDWPRGDALTDFKRTMNWETGVMREEFNRPPGRNPASWKYGFGWRGGTPLQRHPHQIFSVNGRFGWHADGPGAVPVAAPPGDSELWQLDLWLNPVGFLQAARKPGANPRAVWRWELGESGRDGHTTTPEKVTVVSITVLGKHHVDATINKENLLQRIHTRVPDPVLGDANIEHEFSNETYVDLGGGMRFPTVWHSHTGWDDNFGALNASAGHNGFGGVLKDVRVNACPDPVKVPRSVRSARFDTTVTTERLADGVFLMGNSTHNSIAVEFGGYIAVVEAPLDEARNLAVIEAIVKAIPNKPIRYLVNTHQHFDHIGGLRTYAHIGATIVTHWKNFPFYNRDVVTYASRTLAPDMLSLWPPTELAEGYQWETVRENYTIADSRRSMQLSYVQPLAHTEGMLIAWLPDSKIAIEADLYDPPPPGEPAGLPSASNRSFRDPRQAPRPRRPRHRPDPRPPSRLGGVRPHVRQIGVNPTPVSPAAKSCDSHDGRVLGCRHSGNNRSKGRMSPLNTFAVPSRLTC